jgi:hypothetical protein
MSLILSGSDGLSDVDGSASTPAIRGTDTNTGIFFPADDTIAFAEGGAEAMRIDSDGNVGIGTTSPTTKLDVSGQARFNSGATASAAILTSTNAGGTALNIQNSGTVNSLLGGYNSIVGSGNATDVMLSATQGILAFGTGASSTERMRIDIGGNLNIGTTSTLGKVTIFWDSNAQQGIALKTTSGTFNGGPIQFLNSSGVQAGAITQTASSVTYTTGSDYRLKENIAPMTGALATVSALKPVTYTWKADGSTGQGFIAHELQEIAPYAVTGEKDGEQMQGVDYGKITPLLTAALQEALAKIESLEARLAVLESK